jgi:hypothetical protein
MNIQKPICLLAFFLLPCLVFSQVKFGVQGGFILSKTDASNVMTDLKTDYKLGPMVGLMAGLNLGAGNFSLMQEFNYVFKGAKISGTDHSLGTPVPVNGSQTIRYAEFPFNVLYYLQAGNGHFFFGGGPYAAIGLNGNNKIRYEMSPTPEVEEVEVEFGNEPSQIKRFDYGVQGLFGYKLGYGSYLKAYYSYGLAELSNIDEYHYANRYFGLSFGYFFGSGK